MAYALRSGKGARICKDGDPILASDTFKAKIEQLDEKNKTFVAVASTEDEDRDKDIIRQDGWKLANYRKNPIIPWSHNYYSVPIARSLKTWIDKDGPKGPRLLFMPKFDPDDDNSMKIFNKYKNGFLTSFSVGFRGIKFNFRDEEDRWRSGMEFLQQELLEISAVAVPANPNASVRLSIDGNTEIKNLIQMGYPEVFALTKSGLFYPVMDMATFTHPKEFDVGEGVTAIRATPLDEDLSVKNPVAYIFDPELFDDKTANEWINKNVEDHQQVKYFDLNVNSDGSFSLSGIVEEDSIKRYTDSIDFSNIDDSDDSENKENDLDVEFKSGEEKNDSSKTLENDALENKNVPETKTVLVGDDTPFSDEIVIPVKTMIEVLTTIKDHEGNIIDQVKETVASSQEIKTVSEYRKIKDNKLISIFKSEISDLKNVISDLRGEKHLANSAEMPDNKGYLDVSDEEDSEKSSTSDEESIELDASLINSPGDNDKTNSDLIEIDDSFLDSTSSSAKEAVNSALAKRLRDSLREALKGASGRID